ncbi:MAG: bifunctional 2-polyprenyl-6-hydroxyphenol methylase/3-demethylubiquinol 3-O-methyltransferase UbiG [Alphaproteobacteria bacterium]|nr:bifunctional 2-polyprenyl-6-hydroxyphenol methylase/3-demethylubiquinol 3-O-methyltransferase UbiG [Alphaproteobacteria bacterium]
MSSVDPAEIAQFSTHAGDWWNPDGALRPLHKLNPVRLEYIRDRVCAHFSRQSGGRDAFKGLSILDVGCGGGLLCEPMARLGAKVTGLDASKEAVEEARRHAALSGLAIDYHCGAVEDFGGGKKYDVITALEILEHVADMDALLRGIARLLKPGGIAVFSTVNRTAKSWLLGVVAAEYLLKWVPRGTHDWRKFVRPSELAARLAQAGLEVSNIAGVAYDPLNDRFDLRDGAVAVNYMMTAHKA